MSNFVLHPDQSNDSIITNIGRTIRALDNSKKWQVTIKPYKEIRSREQEAYYWAVMIPTICKWYHESRGVAISEKVMHESLKDIYVPYTTEQGLNGEIRLYKSTTALTVKEYNEMFEKMWADFADQGCDIRPPDRDFKKRGG